MCSEKTLILVGCTATKDPLEDYLPAKERYWGQGYWFQKELRPWLQLTNVSDEDWRVITQFQDGEWEDTTRRGYFVLCPEDRIKDYDNPSHKKYDKSWWDEARPLLEQERDRYHRVIVLTSHHCWQDSVKKELQDFFGQNVFFPIPVAENQGPAVRQWLKRRRYSFWDEICGNNGG